MKFLSIIICMIFMHIVDDYYLQGWLASAKQRKWWKDNAPEDLYKYDYIWALIMHSFSWSFMIMIPIVVAHNFDIGVAHITFLIVNTITHALIDNAKANKYKINLWQDQILHLTQIIFTAVCIL